MNSILSISVLLAFAIAAPSCGSNPKPQKGGSATASASVTSVGSAEASGEQSAPQTQIAVNGLPTATMTQPENPENTSSQQVSFEQVRKTTTPVDTVKTTKTQYPDGRVVTIEEPVPAGTQVVDEVKQEVKQTLGGSWKDTAREIAAKVAGYGKLQMIGIGLMLFSVAGLWYAPLRILLGGGKQFPVAVGVLGGLIFAAPMVIQGNEGPIMIGVVLVSFVVWLVIRVTRKEAEADILKEEIQHQKHTNHE